MSTQSNVVLLHKKQVIVIRFVCIYSNRKTKYFGTLTPISVLKFVPKIDYNQVPASIEQ